MAAAVSVPLTLNAATTAKTGAGLSVTSSPINGARRVTVDVMNQTLQITNAQGLVSNYDYNDMATITVTISGNSTTVTSST